MDGRIDQHRISAVLEWWTEAQRDLPWRQTRDPWLVLVSEVMSQQTQVHRVVPKWRAFIERFPTPISAAAASAGDLISMWDGLGYNRRALMLHRAAVHVTDNHDGVIPEDLVALLALPGVGPYTARAVLAFAFEHDVAVVDTNVGRVLARWDGGSFHPAEAQSRADHLVPSGRGWEWNQAILDFGAQICKKRMPVCADCPARDWCTWCGVGPDPAIGSAAVSAPQSTFEGSDRQGRGRLVASLRRHPVEEHEAERIMGFEGDPARCVAVLRSLLDDGMVVSEDGWLRLP